MTDRRSAEPSGARIRAGFLAGLARFFDLRPGEGARVALLYLMMFTGGTGTAWARAVVDAELLRQLGVAALPWVLGISAATSAIAIAVYAGFADRTSNTRLYAAINATAALALAGGLSLSGALGPALGYGVLAVVMSVSIDLGNLHWATYVNGFYDTQSAKRIFPTVTSAARTAAIFAGATTPLLTARLDSASIVLLRVGTLMVTAALALLLPRLAPHGAAPPVRAPARSYKENLGAGFRLAKGSPFLRWMALSALLLTALSSLAAYRTSELLVAGLGSSKEIADFLGVVGAVANTLMLPFFAVWLGRIIRRIGVGNTSLIFPLGNAGIIAALAAAPGIATAGLEHFSRTAFRLTFQYTSDGLLFNAVPLHVRARARAFIAGLLVPGGVLLGSALLLVLSHAPEALSATLVVGAIAYLLAMLAVRAEYGRALLSMLEANDYSSLLALPVSDLATADRPALERIARSFRAAESPKELVLLAEVYAHSAGEEAAGPLATAAAAARDPRVRAGIVEAALAADLGGEGALSLFRTFAGDGDPRVRRAALLGIMRLAPRSGGASLSQLEPLVADADPDVRETALELLLGGPPGASRARAEGELERLLRSESAEDRARAIHISGRVSPVRFAATLFSALDDPAAIVREAALGVLAGARAAVRLCLARGGAPAGLASSRSVVLLRALHAARFERILGLPRLVFTRIGGALGARQALEEPEGADGADVEEAERLVPAASLLLGLSPRRGRAIVRELASTELDRVEAYRRRVALLSRCPGGAARVLAGVLAEREDRVVDRLLLPLRTQLGEAAAAVVRSALLSPDVRLRSGAVDVIEPLFGAALAMRTGDVLGGAAEEPPEDVARGRARAVLGELARDEEPDVRALASRALLELDEPGRDEEETQMLSAIERLILLKGVSLFESLRLEQLRALADLAIERSYEPGQRVIEEGAPGDSLFVVVRGRVAVEQLRGGRPVRLQSIEAPACVGEMSLFDGRERSASVIAEQDTVLLELGREPVLALARRHPELSLQIIEELSARLRAANDRLAHLEPTDPSGSALATAGPSVGA